MSWMISDIKLDPDQKQVRSIPLKSHQSTLIQGPAGSGKSVIGQNFAGYTSRGYTSRASKQENLYGAVHSRINRHDENRHT